jgi:hypothetical protein
MGTTSAGRIAGAVLIALALTVGIAACSSGKSSDGSTTTTVALSPTTSGVKPVSTITKAQIIEMQVMLDKVGCDVGPNDGVIGPETLVSIKAFQKSAGLTVDGTYGPATKAALTAAVAAGKTSCVLPTPTPPPVGPTGTSAACTSALIGANIGTTFGTDVTTAVTGFGCDAGWAYAYITVTPKAGSDAPSIDVTAVLASRDGQWIVQDRTVVCPGGKMPADIYNGGCLSN